MANKDRPRGFTPVKYTNGAPYRGEMRAIGAKDNIDIWIGDAITLDTGLADQYATGDACLGVAVGFGKRTEMDGIAAGAFDPDNLGIVYSNGTAYDPHTDYVVFYVPAQDMIFEVQSAIDASAAVVGTVYDVVADGTNAGTLGGRSTMELTTDSNHDIEVVEIPQAPDNDPTLIWASYYVQFITQPFAQE